MQIMACLLLMILMLCGCGGEAAELTGNTVIINKDGSIDLVLLESFAQSYYSETELMQMVNEEVAAYNAAYGADKIVVGEHNLLNGVMQLELHFADTASFNGYMPENLLIGTIQDAYNGGYDFNRSLNIVGKEGATIGKNDLQNMADENVVVLDGAMTVRCPNKVTYYSQGMQMDDAKTVTAQTEGVYFIIYK